MLSQTILWFISCYRIEVKVSIKTSVQLELAEAHPNLKHSSLFQSFLPHPSSKLHTFFFFFFFFFFKEYSVKIDNFPNRLSRFIGAACKQLWIHSTLAYFTHFSLIRARNCALFFFFFCIPYSFRNIISKFKNFFQPVRRGVLQMALFLAFLAPFFWSVWALVLQMGL